MLESFYIDVRYELDWVDWTDSTQVENSFHITRTRFLEQLEKIGDVGTLLKQHPYSTIHAVLEDTELSLKDAYFKIMEIIIEYLRRIDQ